MSYRGEREAGLSTKSRACTSREKSIKQNKSSRGPPSNVTVKPPSIFLRKWIRRSSSILVLHCSKIYLGSGGTSFRLRIHSQKLRSSKWRKLLLSLALWSVVSDRNWGNLASCNQYALSFSTHSRKPRQSLCCFKEEIHNRYKREIINTCSYGGSLCAGTSRETKYRAWELPSCLVRDIPTNQNTQEYYQIKYIRVWMVYLIMRPLTMVLEDPWCWS